MFSVVACAAFMCVLALACMIPMMILCWDSPRQ
jgi:hypothetical protein